MSMYDEIEGIPIQRLASDLPETFTATVLSIRRDTKKGEYAGTPILKLELQLEDGTTFTTSYRIPKAYTGKKEARA